jgi:hypothetical protein
LTATPGSNTRTTASPCLASSIEAVANEPYAAWIRREVVAPFGLTETDPDMPLPPGAPFARGHTGKALLGRSQLVPGDYPLNALTPAAGFVSTAGDLARFFAQLSPNAADSPLSRDSRREMTRGQWKNPDAALVTAYGLGTSSGTLGDWNWFGHAGGLLGYISRTAVVPERNMAISVLTNVSNGLAWSWLDGILHVARALAQRGKPTEGVLGWTGRWWNAWGALDLLPAGDRVLVAAPGFLNPVIDAAEIEVTGPNEAASPWPPAMMVMGSPFVSSATKPAHRSSSGLGASVPLPRPWSRRKCVTSTAHQSVRDCKPQHDAEPDVIKPACSHRMGETQGDIASGLLRYYGDTLLLR